MNVTDLTGLGLKFTSLILGYSNGSLLMLLALTAIAAILLGTGLPTTATYLICAILVAPALVENGRAAADCASVRLLFRRRLRPDSADRGIVLCSRRRSPENPACASHSRRPASPCPR